MFFSLGSEPVNNRTAITATAASARASTQRRHRLWGMWGDMAARVGAVLRDSLMLMVQGSRGGRRPSVMRWYSWKSLVVCLIGVVVLLANKAWLPAVVAAAITSAIGALLWMEQRPRSPR